MNTRPRPAIAMPVRRLLPPSHGKAGHRDTHRPAPQLVSGRAHPELHRYSAAPCRSPKTNSDRAGTAVSSHRSPAIERTYEPRNVRQRPLITAITQLSLHLMAHQNRSTPCDRAPATTCPSPMPGSQTTHPGGRNTSMVPGARMNAPRIFMMRGAHCVHVVEEGFAPRRPNAGTARGEAPWCVRDQLIPRRRRQPSRRS